MGSSHRQFSPEGARETACAATRGQSATVRSWFAFALSTVAAALALLPNKSALAANIHPSDSHSWGANIGWINWRTDSVAGAEIGQFVCSGYLYSANVGWIHLGSGRPANGVQYANNSATDYGVNVDPQGNLRGFAYGANLGWIHFEETGGAQVDLETGRLRGFAYGANVGWIQLGDSTLAVRAESLTAGLDADADGMPDAWEILRAGTAGVLGASSDADSDGVSDRDEYLADTDPLNASDHLRITRFSAHPDGTASQLTWTARPTRRYRVEARSALSSDSDWIDVAAQLQSISGDSFSATVAHPANSPHQFFRIRAIRPLAP